jgi:hypothetical protein
MTGFAPFNGENNCNFSSITLISRKVAGFIFWRVYKVFARYLGLVANARMLGLMALRDIVGL